MGFRRELAEKQEMEGFLRRKRDAESSRRDEMERVGGVRRGRPFPLQSNGNGPDAHHGGATAPGWKQRRKFQLSEQSYRVCRKLTTLRCHCSAVCCDARLLLDEKAPVTTGLQNK